MSGNCSICGSGGVIRRGWCTLHYQRWYRTGNPLETGIRRTAFSPAMWQRWLAELNASSPLTAGINHFRQLCADREARS